jgi:hypothetical protein
MFAFDLKETSIIILPKQGAAAISRKLAVKLELHEVARHGEPNLPPYRPIKAPESTPLARMR